MEQSYSTPLDGRGGPDIVFEYSSDSESETGSTESEETSDDDESESSSSEGDISNDAIEDESNDIGFSLAMIVHPKNYLRVLLFQRSKASPT